MYLKLFCIQKYMAQTLVEKAKTFFLTITEPVLEKDSNWCNYALRTAIEFLVQSGYTKRGACIELSETANNSTQKKLLWGYFNS
jgi:hypothetical protein